MNDLSFLDKIKDERILIATLNWGLGHATRCIPIIKALAKRNAILIGSDGLSLELLKREFPDTSYVKLPPYNINYKSNNFLFGIVKQSPKLSLAISKEMSLTEDIVDRFGLSMIISDHRLGCRDKRIKSIIIAHQLQIQAGNKAISTVGSRLNKFFINHFDECWVPDYDNPNMSLSGSLSRPDGLKRIKYIGPLSRLIKRKRPIKYDIVIILSGPEPKRSWLESALHTYLKETDYNIACVRGTTTHSADLSGFDQIFDMASHDQINELFNQSRLIIGRSGYTTIMDAAHLKVRSLLIPTKGQTEQEYLADHLEGRQYFDFLREDELDQLKSKVQSILSDCTDS